MARPSKPWFRSDKNAWYCTLDGRKVSLGVSGEANQAEALKAWHRLMANGRPEHERTKEVPTVAEVVRDFLADAETRLKPKTVQGYRDFLRSFADKHGTLKANRVTPALAEAYSRKPTWSNSTRHDFLTALSIVFKWAGYPIVGLRKPPLESRGTQALVSDTDHARLLEAAPPYFQPLLRLLYLTGARPGEIASITAENFDEANALVTLKDHKTARHGKTRIIFLCPEAVAITLPSRFCWLPRPRIIFLCPEAVAILQEQKAKHGSGYLIPNRHGRKYAKDAIVSMMATLRQKTGVQATAYGYRHSFATDALAKGVPDAHVAELLGHSGTAMLHRHYAHLGARAQVLRSALGMVRD